MKDQYVGDINDYRKYALLRALSSGGANRVGVCWMLTPSDGGMDGSKLGYLDKPKRYRRFDPELFDILAHAAAEPDRRRLLTIESSGAIPRAIYHNDMLPQDKNLRVVYMMDCQKRLGTVDLVFFDPDNGIEVPSAPLGRKNALKYVFQDELAAFYRAGKSILIYQHRPQLQPKATLIASKSEQLRQRLPGAAIWIFTTADVVFFLLIHPESPSRVASAAMTACERWAPEFISGRFLGIEPATP